MTEKLNVFSQIVSTGLRCRIYFLVFRFYRINSFNDTQSPKNDKKDKSYLQKKILNKMQNTPKIF